MSNNLTKIAFPFFQSLVVQGRIRSKELSMAIGYAASKGLSLPSSPSEVVESYFKGTHGANVIEFVSAINNIVPIDYETCLKYAFRFFQLRHDQFFGVGNFPGNGEPYDALTFWGFRNSFDKEEIDILMHDGDFYKMATSLVGFRIEGGF